MLAIYEALINDCSSLRLQLFNALSLVGSLMSGNKTCSFIYLYIFVTGISSRISIKPASLQVTDGDTARLYCHIRNSIPRPNFRWKFKGAFLYPSSKYTMLGSLGVLQIHNVKSKIDDGSYTCVAQNPVNGKKHESSHSTLTVTPGMTIDMFYFKFSYIVSKFWRVLFGL